MLINKDWTNTLNGVLNEDVNRQTTDTSEILIQLQMDLLEGCFYNCPGCFVNKQDNCSKDSLDIALDLVREIHELENFKTDNIILGPTDFFAAGNLFEILEDERFREILTLLDDKCIQHNCGIDEVISNEKIHEVIKKIEGLEYMHSISFDVQIAIDIIRLNTDDKYVQSIHNRIKLFKESSLDYEVSLATNITDDSILENTGSNLYDATVKVQREFGTVLEFLPSVTRAVDKLANGTLKELTLLENWNKILLDTFNKDEGKFLENILLVQSDRTHKTHNELLLNINKSSIYLMPFIYENSVIYDELFKVKGSSLKDIIAHNSTLVERQYRTIPTVCDDCEQLDTCIQRLIPLSMNEIFSTTKCIVNKDILNSYSIEG